MSSTSTSSTSSTTARRCENSRTRDTLSVAEAMREWVWCSRCGARVTVRVHRAKDGGWDEGTMAAHNVPAPREVK